MGRFLSVDPYPGSLRNPTELVNKYLYCSNNPINFVDPWGLDRQKKSDLVDLMNTYGFNLQEQSPGVWSQIWSIAWSKEFGVGIEARISAGTKLTVNYLGGDTYGLNSNIPINICWGGWDIPEQFSTIVSFSQAKIQYNHQTGNLIVQESDMRGSGTSFFMKKDGFENVY